MNNRVHTLGEYLALFKEKNIFKETNIKEDSKEDILKITYDSRNVSQGTLFVCKGIHFSKDYLISAVGKGAVCYISEEKYKVKNGKGEEVPCIIVSDMRKALAYIANFFYNEVWKNFNLIGITGTKGKSTTTYYMKYILDEYLNAGDRNMSGILSGINIYDGTISEESHLTTPETFELFNHFNNIAKNDIEYLTMEVSSQALKYDRTLGITFDVGCFLNIDEDHISDIEHPSYEDYFQSKIKIFAQCKSACVNLESKEIDRILEAAKVCPNVITFGLHKEADVYGYDIEPDEHGINFKVKSKILDDDFEISMTGLFNVENALAAIAMSCCLSIPLEHIKTGLRKAKVRGRMEVYKNEEGKCVIVDYAHNKMSFETLFKSAKKEYPGKKITIVFGCPGKKALGRRKELGSLAGEYADLIYITEEDPGEESAVVISREIEKHIKEWKKEVYIILDREAAIKEAIRRADENTVILFTGKGRETRQKRGTKYVETPSDVDYVKKHLGI